LIRGCTGFCAAGAIEPTPVPESDDPLDPLVEQMLAGDETALRGVYRDVQPRLIRYLTVLVGPHDAEDVASETWAQAFRDLDRFAGGADGFRGWLTTIGRHRALDHLRRLQRQPRADLELAQVLDRPADDDVEATVADTLGTEAALAMVADLPTDQAEAIMLRTVLGFDAPAAARILGKRPGAVRSATHRGLRALARRLPNDGSRNFPSTRDTSDTIDAEGT
jgi:RNA polymerase sigma-70 factor (ECF subfamily)